MLKNRGQIKRTIEEYMVLTVATLILVVGVWRSYGYCGCFECGDANNTGKYYVYYKYGAVGVWIYFFRDRVWREDSVCQRAYLRGFKCSGEAFSDVGTADITAGVGADLCDRTSGGELGDFI